jgi:hypothetical protein
VPAGEDLERVDVAVCRASGERGIGRFEKRVVVDDDWLPVS